MKTPTVTLTENKLNDLHWRMTEKDDECTPLEAVGAWLWSFASGSEQERDDLLRVLNLTRKPTPQGGNSIKENK